MPGGGADAFLFAALAVLVACCLHFSSLSAVFVLVAGALFEGLVFPLNLGRWVGGAGREACPQGLRGLDPLAPA